MKKKTREMKPGSPPDLKKFIIGLFLTEGFFLIHPDFVFHIFQFVNEFLLPLLFPLFFPKVDLKQSPDNSWFILTSDSMKGSDLFLRI